MGEQSNTFDYINVDNNIHNIHREMLFFNCLKNPSFVSESVNFLSSFYQMQFSHLQF